MKSQTLSIVVPVYNEEDNIQRFFDGVSPVIDRLEVEAEIIFVDDGSRDRTAEKVQLLINRDARIRLIRLSRNFGSHAALMAGFREASGDAAVMMSVDLQDPPDLLPELITEWQAGSKVVWGVRESRDDPFFKKLFARMFYGMIRRIAIPEYPEEGMDFGLFDRCIIDRLNANTEANAFLPGLIVWMGYPQAQIGYHRRAREVGETKWSFAKRVKCAMDAIIGFSNFPVRAISYLGAITSIAGFLGVVAAIAASLTYETSWGWVIALGLVFIGGLQISLLGVVGEYIWRGVDQTRGRPTFIVTERSGFKSAGEQIIQEMLTS